MFVLNKFRISQPINYFNSFNEYINLNFQSKSKSTQDCSGIINELQQTRDLIGSFSNKNTTPEQLSKNIQLCLSYINALENLNGKVSIANDNSSLKLPFSWKETSNGAITKSYNIYYEICSVKFNIGILFCLIGYHGVFKKDADLLKESLKAFEKAAYYFKEIKELVPSKKVVNDRIPDFIDSYIESCYNFALGMGQLCVVTISRLKSFSKPLISKLSMATSVFFSRIYKTSFTCAADKSLVNFYSLYYEGLSYYYAGLNVHDTNCSLGKGYGLVIAHLNKANDLFTQCKELSLKVKNFMDYNDYLKVADENGKMFRSLDTNNKNVYKERVPNTNQIPIPESCEKVKATEHKEEIKEFEFISEINNLVSKELQPLLNDYLNQMYDYLNDELKSYETEKSVDEYLRNHNLPQILSMGCSSISISDSTYNGLQKIKDLGGIEYLSNQISSIDMLSVKVFNLVNLIHQKIISDKEIDSKNQLLYGNEWKTQSNPAYEQQVNQYKNAINKAKEIDNKTKLQISEHSKYYELVGLPKHVLEMNVPKNVSENSINSLCSYQPLNGAYNKLINDKNELKGLIDKLKKFIQTTVPLSDLINVLKRTKSLMFVLTDKKQELKSKIQELEGICNVIRKDYEVINEKVLTFKNESVSVSTSENEETKKYLDFLGKAEQAFRNDLNCIQNGMNFYIDCENKLNKLDDELKSYLSLRNMEREELIETLTSLGRYKLAH